MNGESAHTTEETRSAAAESGSQLPVYFAREVQQSSAPSTTSVKSYLPSGASLSSTLLRLCGGAPVRLVLAPLGGTGAATAGGTAWYGGGAGAVEEEARLREATSGRAVDGLRGGGIERREEGGGGGADVGEEGFCAREVLLLLSGRREKRRKAILLLSSWQRRGERPSEGGTREGDGLGTDRGCLSSGAQPGPLDSSPWRCETMYANLHTLYPPPRHPCRPSSLPCTLLRKAMSSRAHCSPRVGHGRSASSAIVGQTSAGKSWMRELRGQKNKGGKRGTRAGRGVAEAKAACVAARRDHSLVDCVRAR